MLRLCLLSALILCAPPPIPSSHASHAAADPKAPRQIQIDLDRSVGLAVPANQADLTAVRFTTPDGHEGWALRIPGNRPIATPAIAGGRLFVGGGYGSHEFYAIDAVTGAVAWQVKTSDDGPTAAVVEDGCVAFNTESCTVVVLDAETGRTLWQEWLGDPLMSQPAIAHGRLYMAYPGGQSGHGQQMHVGNDTPLPEPPRHGEEVGWRHRLLCADLHTGRHLWVQAIPAEVITAPVIDGSRVYVTCFDGSSLCFDAANGSRLWVKHNGATSAPVIANGQMVLTEKSTVAGNVREGLKRFDAEAGAARDTSLLAAGSAEYLKSGGASTTLAPHAQHTLDASVGFANAPASAGLAKAADQIGVNTVVGGWAYQGSKAAYRGGQILNAQGQRLNCVTAKDGRIAWQAEARGKGLDKNAQLFAPPALGRENLYACTSDGHVLAVRQKDGATLFAYATGKPMAFQPALWNGRIYSGTSDGMILCLATGDKDATAGARGAATPSTTRGSDGARPGWGTRLGSRPARFPLTVRAERPIR